MQPTGNAIRDLLDSIGLPWRSPLTELVERYGIRSDGPNRWDVVSIPTRPPLLGGLLRPIEATVHRQLAADLPTGEASQALRSHLVHRSTGAPIDEPEGAPWSHVVREDD